MARPGEETNRDVFHHGWIALIVAALLLAGAAISDLRHPGQHYFKACGPWINLIAGYVAYRAAKVSIVVEGGIKSFNYGLPYGWMAFVLAFVGTLVGEYGDRFF